MIDILWVLAAIAVGAVAFALFLGIIIGLAIGAEKVYRWTTAHWNPPDIAGTLITVVEWVVTFLVVVGGGGVALYCLGAALLGASHADFGWPPIPEWMQVD